MRLAVLTFAGFAVHAWLPLRWRLHFFVVLSLGAIVMVLGLREGAWLIGLGALLIALCHLPIPFWGRVAAIAVVGIVLAGLRVELVSVPWSRAIWPILGSMFMFRLIVYLYDLRHDTASFSLPRSLAYFFLLPNICFPLFPVVDFKTFRRTYFDADAGRIYQTGVDWMARGVVHLICYRFVYYYATLSPAEVQSPATFGQFVMANFLLYLRVSGQFHLIVGMLHLFGFRLPETHHRYYLASSFTDFWRRINIYWKDFMLKIFFNPLYFRLKRLGPERALVDLDPGGLLRDLGAARVPVVLAPRERAPDLDGRRLLGHPRRPRRGERALRDAPRPGAAHRGGHVDAAGGGGLDATVAATFASICLLWSLWTSDSFTSWFALWGALFDPALPGKNALLPMLTAVAVLAVSGGGTGRLPRRRPRMATHPVAHADHASSRW